jgi:hypothetical protein
MSPAVPNLVVNEKLDCNTMTTMARIASGRGYLVVAELFMLLV